MKTIEEILDFERPASEIIADLKNKVVNVQDWSKLDKEYDPKKHPVMTDPTYADKVKNGQVVRMSRITYGWQKLATKRMAEMVFAIPSGRIYNAKTDGQKKAMRVMEAIYKKNRINGVNLDRARRLYAGCEFVTIWFTQEAETVYDGNVSPLKLRNRTFSPMKGEMLYPLFDDYDDMIALSVSYSRNVGNVRTEYFETYTSDIHMRWRAEGSSWVEDMEPEQISIGKIPGVYGVREEVHIWEYESGNVFELEWSTSRNGNYIRKNAKPTWVVIQDKDKLDEFGREPDTDTTARNVVHYPAGTQADYKTWSQSVESLKYHQDSIRKNFFMQLQLPDYFYDMKTSPMSGESRKIMFVDAELKVIDESGLWEDVLYREFNVIKAFAKAMFPSMAKDIESLEVEIKIYPYHINDDKETVSNLTAATGGKAIMSQRTAIAMYGEVDDPDEEMAQMMREDAQALEETVY